MLMMSRLHFFFTATVISLCLSHRSNVKREEKKLAFVHALWKWVFEVISFTLSLTHSISICWNIFHMCVKLVFAFPFYFNSFIACCDFRFFSSVFFEFFEGFAFCIQIQFTSVGEFMRQCKREMALQLT